MNDLIKNSKNQKISWHPPKLTILSLKETLGGSGIGKEDFYTRSVTS